jgi:hypothetical protein
MPDAVEGMPDAVEAYAGCRTQKMRSFCKSQREVRGNNRKIADGWESGGRRTPEKAKQGATNVCRMPWKRMPDAVTVARMPYLAALI